MKFKVLLLLLVTKLSFSQSLDSTFGTSGVVTSQLSNSPTNNIATTAIMQPDGKTVMVGLYTTLYGVSSVVVRTNTNGTLDTSFNSIGYRSIPGQGFEAVGVQTDGKIIVAGQDKAYRLNSDGSIDYEFGTSGFVKLYFGDNMWMTIKSIATINSKIILGGYSRVANGEYKFTLVQLNSDGSFDSSFDGDGKAFYYDTSTTSDLAYAIKVQADNKIVMTGQTSDDTTIDDNFLTIRVNSDGSLDTDFGTSGKVITSFATGDDYGRNLEIQSDGKILVIGGNNNRYAIARYNTNGSLDTSFDGDGKVYLTNNLSLFISSSQVIYDRPNIKSLSSGKIVISGTSNFNFNLIRLNQNGSFDSTFGANGVVNYTANVRNRSSYLIINSDNKIITGGSSHNNTGNNISKINQIQFSENGSFESNVDLTLLQGVSRISNAIEQADGKIITFIENRNNTFDCALVRYNSNGSIDSSFGNNGMQVIGQGMPNKMIPRNNGKLAVSYLNSPNIYGYNSDGTPDNAFGTNGAVNIDQLNSIAFNVSAFTSSADGSIYVATSTNSGTFGLLKILPNGAVDNTFGTNGITSISFNYFPNNNVEIPTDVMLLSDGRIILAGILRFSGQIAVTGICCFLPNGTVDTSFGTNGKITIQHGNLTSPSSLIHFENDSFAVNNFSSDFNKYIITKFSSNGLIDTNFSFDSTPNLYGIYSGIAQSDGKILIAGRKNYYDNGEFLIVRYLPDGGLDPSFGTNGEFTIPILNGSTITDFIPLADGKFLASGYANTATHILLAMAKMTDEDLETYSFENNKNKAVIAPNPFKEETLFDYEIDKESHVTIELLDLNGKIVQTIMTNQFQTEGHYQQRILFNKTATAGEYIVRLSVGNQIQSLKIIKSK